MVDLALKLFEILVVCFLELLYHFLEFCIALGFVRCCANEDLGVAAVVVIGGFLL